MSQFNPGDFTMPKPKPLPIVLLLDKSGSMSGIKIQTLNVAVKKMLATLLKEESGHTEFLISMITFGATSELAHPPASAGEFMYRDLTASGGTPLGAAIEVAKSLIEDRERTPGRAFRPLVVLVSDGQPTDSWKDKLEDFVSHGRSSKCDRMALAIGPEAVSGVGRSTLEKFITGTEHRVFEANEAEDIPNFFKFVTMSVVTRSLSVDPNQIPNDQDLTPPIRDPDHSAQGDNPPSPPPPPADDGYW
jgi:uncharacterized protein YegL